ncbi:MAG: transcriptional regulator [Clostridiales bacterium]|jgi:hypothetical protein|nr:transcriptional regulator [Clostridiales bacterium]
MNDKLDFKKQYKDLYQPGTTPSLIEIPPIPYLMVDGVGAPEGEAYGQALEMLYAVTFTIKMSKMNGTQPAGYVEYVVPPLEGLWDCGAAGFDAENRENWRWTSLLRQPDFVTGEVFGWAVDIAAKKKPGLPFDRVRLETYDEGLCVQQLHVGPYSTEQETIDQIGLFIRDNGLTDQCGTERRHHEVYLSDPRRTKPERLRTILRHPVARG